MNDQHQHRHTIMVRADRAAWVDDYAQRKGVTKTDVHNRALDWLKFLDDTQASGERLHKSRPGEPPMELVILM